MEAGEISGKISDIKSSLEFLTRKTKSISTPNLRKSFPAVIPKKSFDPDKMMATPHFPM